MAPKEAPTRASAAQTRAMSRSSVRQIERMYVILNAGGRVRQVERSGWWSEQVDGPIAVIAASIRRERERAGLSLSELAKRAGIAKSTLSQLESGLGNPSVETLWALGGALGVPFSRLGDPPHPAGPA